jgi:hypothetical protein
LETEMMKWTTLALFCAAVACSSTTTKPPLASASGVGAPKADFTKYQTFSFATANPPAPGYETTERSLEVQNKLAPLVKASLEKRGYAPAAENADLLIRISSGSGTLEGEKTQRGNPGDASAAGFIGIDAYDRQTGAGIWHGFAFAEIDPKRIDDGLLARGVDYMLAEFPAR